VFGRVDQAAYHSADMCEGNSRFVQEINLNSYPQMSMNVQIAIHSLNAIDAKMGSALRNPNSKPE